MSVLLTGFINLNRDVAEKPLCSQNFSWPRKPPVAIYPEQDLSWAKTAMVGRDKVPPADLILFTVENGCFAIGGGLDGVVFDDKQRCIEETAYFTPIDKNSCISADYPQTLPLSYSETILDEVFIGFDAAWMNYFHWICYGITKSYFASKILSGSCQIILPDYDACSNEVSKHRRRFSFTRAVWEQSLKSSTLTDRVSLLPPGLYKARKIHLLSCNTSAPTDIMMVDQIYRVFASIRSGLLRDTVSPKRIFISRRGVPDKRIDPKDQDRIQQVLENYGFLTVNLEELDFSAQTSLFYNAEMVIAPHGAGLVNILFAPESLKVFELNRKIANDESLRPWFYMLASQRQQQYAFLDGSDTGFSPEHIQNGIETLLF